MGGLWANGTALARATFEQACRDGRRDIARLLRDVDGEAAAKKAARTAARNAGHADLAALIGIPPLHACIIAPPTATQIRHRLGHSPALQQRGVA